MNNEKKNHTMKSIQGRTKGKKDVDQVERHEWLRATVTRLKSETKVFIIAAPVDWRTVEFFFLKISLARRQTHSPLLPSVQTFPLPACKRVFWANVKTRAVLQSGTQGKFPIK